MPLGNSESLPTIMPKVFDNITICEFDWCFFSIWLDIDKYFRVGHKTSVFEKIRSFEKWGVWWRNYYIFGTVKNGNGHIFNLSNQQFLL